MKKFLCILALMIVSMSAYCQYINKVPADERQKEQWRNAMTEIRVGKTMMWSSVAVASITTGVGLIWMSNNRHNAEVGDVYKTIINQDGSVREITYSQINKTITTAMVGIDVVCAITAALGVYKQINGRHKLDKLYFNGGGVTWIYEF